MIVLKDTDTTFKIIPRSYDFDTIILKSETTNKEQTHSVTPTQVDYYAEITAPLELKEGNFYALYVFNGTNLVYRDKIFCTNQDVNTFTVNKDGYVSNSTTNEFITYE